MFYEEAGPPLPAPASPQARQWEFSVLLRSSVPDPGPKSEVSWSRADKEESGGKISYRDKCMCIAKK